MNRIPLLLALPLLGALLAACGGNDLSEAEAGADGRVSIAAAPQAPWPIAPLLADDGSVMPSAPQAVPADPGARTRAGRYATAAQAEQLERTLGPGAVRVAVRGSDAPAVEEGAGQVHRQLAAWNLPDSAPVMIDGADPRAAAALVDLLATQGLHNVWLVTQ